MIIRFEAYVHNNSESSLFGCLLNNVRLTRTSDQCRHCFLELSVCIIAKCSASCINENNHEKCERGTKDQGCSLNKCISPNHMYPEKYFLGVFI